MQLMSAEQSYFDQATTTRIIDYTVEVQGLRTPDEVLNRLDDIISEKSPFAFMAPTGFPSRSGTGAVSNWAKMSSCIGMSLTDGWRNGPHLSQADILLDL